MEPKRIREARDSGQPLAFPPKQAQDDAFAETDELFTFYSLLYIYAYIKSSGAERNIWTEER
jgi:hypothetical protein